VMDAPYAAAVVLETHEAWRRLRARQLKCTDGGSACWQPEAASVSASQSQLLARTVLLKLNGGLGTSMGLDKPKSLLPVHANGRTFLDLIVEQVSVLRRKFGAQAVKMVLMNSFSTSQSTAEFLKENHPKFEWEELLQNQIPKIDVTSSQSSEPSYKPVEWAKNPANEWTPPGHGDLYTALEASGMLDKMLADGMNTCLCRTQTTLEQH